MTPYTATSYQKVPNSHGCCTSTTDAIATDPAIAYHQRCGCYLPLAECMQFCNDDAQCKGYVESHTYISPVYCQIATVSECPSGCSSHDVGSVGELIVDGTCGSGYGGCFIKTRKGNIQFFVKH